jgi:hypothetical protein
MMRRAGGMALQSFANIDQKVPIIGAAIVHIGRKAIYCPDDVSIITSEGYVPPDKGSDGWIGIEERLFPDF